MAANIPNMGNIDKAAAQLNTNIFKPLQQKSLKAAKVLNRLGQRGPASYSGTQPPNFRTTKAGPKPSRPVVGSLPGGTGASPFHPNFYNVQQGSLQGSKIHTPAITTGQRQITSGQGSIEAFKPGPKATATPYQAPQRTFEMGGGKNPVPKNLQATQRGLFSAGPYKTFPKKSEPVVQQAQMGQMKGQGHLITPGGNISKPALPPARNSLQFADTSTKNNAPFPTHVHPEGSSSAILPHLSATESAKTGRENTFTMGSRNIKGSGIAAMGSRLEQGLAQRPLTLPERGDRK